MLDRNTLEKTIIEAAHQQGYSLDGKELLDIRTAIASSLAAKERYRQRMMAPAYEWKKPGPRR